MMVAAPAWLWLLLLLPAIALLHLRRRRRTLEVGNLGLWRRVASHESPSASRWSFAKPTWRWRMFAQLLAVLAVVLALADVGPYSDAPRVDHHIYVIDGSIAMQARTADTIRFRSSINQVVAEAAALQPRDPVSIIHVTDQPRLLRFRSPAGSVSHATLDALRVTDATPRWERAAQLVSNLLHSGEGTRIVVWTGPESADASFDALSGAVPSAAIEVAVIGDEAISNAGLHDISVTPHESSTNGAWTVAGQVLSYGMHGQRTSVSAHYQPIGTAGFVEWARRDITLDDIRGASFSHVISVPESGIVEVRLESDDAISSDNRVAVVLEPAMPTRVLRVGEANSAIDRALASVQSVALFVSDVVPPEVDSFDLVVIDGVESEVVPDTSTVWVGVRPPGISGSPERAPSPAVSSWNANHVLSRGLDWSAVSIGQSVPMPVLAHADVLVDGPVGPLIQARTTSRGRQVVLAFDIRESTWPAHTGFPAFFAALVDWATPDRPISGASGCRVGTACALPTSSFDPTWQIQGPAGTVSVEPTGYLPIADDILTSHVWPGQSHDVQFRPVDAGVHEFTYAGGQRSIPVHVAPYRPDSRTISEHVPRWHGPYQGPRTSVVRWLLTVAILLVVIDAALARVAHENMWSARFAGLTVGLSRYVLARVAVVAAVVTLVAALFSFPSPHIHRVTNVAQITVGDRGALEQTEPLSTILSSRSSEILRVHVGRPDVSADTASDERTPIPQLDEFGDAIATALAGLDTDVAMHILLATDQGILLGADRYVDAVNALRSADARVDVLDLRSDAERTHLQIVHVNVPENARAGDTVAITVTVRNDGPGEADLQVSVDGVDVADAAVPPSLDAVQTTLSISAPLEPGTALLEVALASRDSLAATAATVPWKVGTAPQVLILTLDDRVGAALASMLVVQGLDVEVESSRFSPLTVDSLTSYDVIVLQDLPAVAIHTRHQEMLLDWVSTRGGGLVILGGEHAFGPGGYMLTPLDTVSPLSSQVPDEAPEVTIVFVLDRSGSMSASVGPMTRLQIAQASTIGALDLLGAASQVGIIAFDSTAEVISPIRPLQDRLEIERSVASVRAGGGTEIYPGLVEALNLLRGVDSHTKHVVVFTDGLSRPGDFPGVLSALRDIGASTSFVGIGDGADRSQLTQLAALGGGAFHFSDDFNALPGIMAQEAMLLASDPVERNATHPIWVSPRPQFAATLDGDTPMLGGFTRTTAKDAATVHMTDGSGDYPILASWRYGLGRVIAFTSQSVGSWSTGWNANPTYRNLWPQLMRWATTSVAQSGLSSRMWLEGDQLFVEVDAFDTSMRPIPGASIEAVVRAGTGAIPGRELTRRTLVEYPSGRYAASMPAPTTWGLYTLSVQPEVHPGGMSRSLQLVEETFSIPDARTPALTSGTSSIADFALAGVAHFIGPHAQEYAVVRHLTLRRDFRPWAFVALLLYAASLALRYAPSRLATSR